MADSLYAGNFPLFSVEDMFSREPLDEWSDAWLDGPCRWLMERISLGGVK